MMMLMMKTSCNLSGQPRISFLSCYLPGVLWELPNNSDVDAPRLA